jgi:hypothetical protein
MSYLDLFESDILIETNLNNHYFRFPNDLPSVKSLYIFLYNDMLKVIEKKNYNPRTSYRPYLLLTNESEETAIQKLEKGLKNSYKDVTTNGSDRNILQNLNTTDEFALQFDSNSDISFKKIN